MRNKTAKKDCPHCRRPSAMQIALINERGREVLTTKGAVQSIWKCKVCSNRADHE